MSTQAVTVVANSTQPRLSAGRAAWLSIGITASIPLGLEVADVFPTIPVLAFYLGLPIVTARVLRGTWWPPTTLIRGQRWEWMVLGSLTASLAILRWLTYAPAPSLRSIELAWWDAHLLGPILWECVFRGLAWFEHTNKLVMVIVSSVMVAATACLSDACSDRCWDWWMLSLYIPWILPSLVSCFARIRLGLCGAIVMNATFTLAHEVGLLGWLR